METGVLFIGSVRNSVDVREGLAVFAIIWETGVDLMHVLVFTVCILSEWDVSNYFNDFLQRLGDG